MTVAAIVQK